MLRIKDNIDLKELKKFGFLEAEQYYLLNQVLLQQSKKLKQLKLMMQEK